LLPYSGKERLAMWMWQGCNASCWDQVQVLLSVLVVVKDGRQTMASCD